METEKIFEQIEAYSHNVKITIELVRHGEKDSTGVLTEEGKRAAAEFGEQKNAKAYHSGHNRHFWDTKLICYGSTRK